LHGGCGLREDCLGHANSQNTLISICANAATRILTAASLVLVGMGLVLYLLTRQLLRCMLRSPPKVKLW
jgi:hypothetical protein